MAFLHTFSVSDFVDTLISVLAAFVLGTLIGAERQYRGEAAGCERTHWLLSAPPRSLTLVCTSTATPGLPRSSPMWFPVWGFSAPVSS
jgi:uncharacterized membrane protein YhiD involved in acid resistance